MAPPKNEKLIDNKKLREEMLFKIFSDKVNLSDVAETIGMSRSSTSRLNVFSKPFRVSQRMLFGICRWLGVPPDYFYFKNSDKIVYYPNSNFPTVLRAVLDADKTLDQKSKDALYFLMKAAYEKNIF